MPKALVSDRDPVFTSALWQQLFKLTDTKLLMSSSYHPQTDGQTERLNQRLEGFLRCTVHSCPRQWSKWISVAEYMACISTATLVKEAVMLSTERPDGTDPPAPRLAPLTLHTALRRTSRLPLGLAVCIYSRGSTSTPWHRASCWHQTPCQRVSIGAASR